MLGVLFAMFPANNGNLPEVHIAALYSATSRTIWALSLSWITFACVTGNGGFINSLLSAKIWIPFSRLTHCAYLVHPIVMAVFYGSRTHAFDFSTYLIVRHLILISSNLLLILYIFQIYFTISHIVVTYVIAFIVSLLIESPFIAISKLFFSTKS